MQVNCSVTNKYKNWGGYWRGNSGYGLRVTFKDTVLAEKQIPTPLSIYQNPGTYTSIGDFDFEFYATSSGTIDISTNVFYGGAGRVGSQSAIPADCRGATASQGFNGTYSNFIDYEIPDPYKAPTSYWIQPQETIVKPKGWRNYDWEISGGTNNIDWIKTRVFPYDKTWTYGNGTKPSGWIWNLDTSGPTGSSPAGAIVTDHDSTLSAGSRYRIAIWFSDNKYEWISGDDKVIYTYQEPKLNNSLNIQTTPSRANQSNKFTFSGCNDRAWTSYEDEFQTRYRIKRGTADYTAWTSIGNVKTEWSRTAAQMRALVPKSYDNVDCTLQIERYSPSAAWESTNKPTRTFRVIYRPLKGVTCPNTTYKKNTSGGGGISKGALVINDNNLTGIYVSWTYDATTADAGYTQGYRVRLYNANQTVVKTYYTTNKSITIPKADIPKMQKTYIDVTPYFGNDQANVASSTYGGNYWYYAGTITKCDFVVMAAKLAKPTITYPVEGSQWINKQFRVCFQLPTDGDKGSETETYKYDDIEVSVNDKVFRLTASPAGGTSGAVQAVAAFSSESLTYQRKMIVAPFKASNFPSATTYKIKVRVKKKYTADKSNWSDWSGVRTFTVATASFTPAVGDIIYATHYNNAKSVINRVRNTYGVAWSNIPADVSKGTIIYRTQYPYANLYDRIVATKNQVNNYGTFDSGHTDVRFDNSNAITASFTQYVELVTAASNESKSDASGRNYMRIVYDRCNKLI